jgi:ABC-type lipoprotein release transport system permease subunit
MKRMIWSISWKNIWRNRVRSLVVIVAVILGLIGGTLSVGVMTGWIEQRIDASIYNEISHVQIHHPDYVNNEELQYTIQNYDEIKNVLDTMSGVVDYASRFKVFAMVQSDWAATGMIIKGINLEEEKKISRLSDFIIEGDYFEKDSRLPSIVIGSKAAENLKLLNYQIDEEKYNVLDSLEVPKEVVAKIDTLKSRRYRTEKQFIKALSSVLTEKEVNEYQALLIKQFSFYRLRAKVTITMTDTAENMVPITYRVTGIYRTSNSAFDGMNAFVLEQPLRKETGFGKDFIHEVAIICLDNETATVVSKRLKEIFPEQNVMSWKVLAPDVAYMSDMMKVMDFIYVGIILLALAFGIINTMLMAVLERAKELGMLMAIGMNKLRVFSMIMIESVLLTLTGAAIGMGISAILIAIFQQTGINLTMWAEGIEAFGFSSVIYPVLTLRNYIDITILVVLTGVIASIWPARKALKMNPAEALRTE